MSKATKQHVISCYYYYSGRPLPLRLHNFIYCTLAALAGIKRSLARNGFKSLLRTRISNHIRLLILLHHDESVALLISVMSIGRMLVSDVARKFLGRVMILDLSLNSRNFKLICCDYNLKALGLTKDLMFLEHHLLDHGKAIYLENRL